MKMLRLIWAVLLTEFQGFREECELTETEYRNAGYITYHHSPSRRVHHLCLPGLLQFNSKYTEEMAADDKPG